MKDIICNFLLMIQFLTRIPVNKSLPCERENFRKASVFIPVIGLIVGTIQWVAFKLFVKILPISTTVVIVLLVGVIVTGALHIDGLGDMCDGFFAFKGNDKIIEIMKDSRIGSYACIVIILDLLFKFTLLSYIAPRFSLAIVATPIISRFSIIFIAFIGKPAKSTGSGNLFIGNIGISELIISGIITIAILVLIMTPKYILILIFSALIMTFFFNLFCKKKIGGLTGDLLGANNEVIEILVLMLMAIIIK